MASVAVLADSFGSTQSSSRAHCCSSRRLGGLSSFLQGASERTLPAHVVGARAAGRCRAPRPRPTSPPRGTAFIVGIGLVVVSHKSGCLSRALQCSDSPLVSPDVLPSTLGSGPALHRGPCLHQPAVSVRDRGRLPVNLAFAGGATGAPVRSGFIPASCLVGILLLPRLHAGLSPWPLDEPWPCCGRTNTGIAR